MLNQYETVFIMTPVLSDDQMKETVKKFEDFLKQFKVDTSVIQELEILYRRDERIIRFLTVKLDKYSIEYNESRRKKAKAAKKEPVPSK